MKRLSLDDPRWRSFVEKHPGAAAFHHPAWASLLSRSYGYDAFALCLTDNAGAVRAGAPFLDVTNIVSRRSWVSLPFTDYCAPLMGEAGAAAFAEALIDVREEAGVSRIEVRAELPVSRRDRIAVRHLLALTPDVERLRRGFSQSQVARNIRRAQREGVEVRAAADEDALEVFYRLHLATRRQQGVPIQPRRFFDLLWEQMLREGLGHCLIAEAGGTPLAAAVFLTWGRTTIYKYGASDRRFLAKRPNHSLFWHAIASAAEAGQDFLDFGRTDLSNEGLRRFKSAWGASEEPLVYSSIGLERGGAAATAAAGLLERVIRRSPRFVCRAIGETLYRYSA